MCEYTVLIQLAWFMNNTFEHSTSRENEVLADD